MLFVKTIYCLCLASLARARYVMYLTGQHPIIPSPDLVSQITDVTLAFMSSSIFNTPNQTSFPLFTTVSEVRSKFAPGTAVLVAIGGWGDTEGFPKAATSEESREIFARNVKEMVDRTGADGVDVDWEYPGGNGEDYRQIPNSEKTSEIQTYPLLLAAIRKALGPKPIISAAVPGLARDMMAFTSTTLPLIIPSITYLNIMTYDLMNRRDNVTKHHTGITASFESAQRYIAAGLPPEKANLGFAFYIKWFRTAPNGGCNVNPIGCNTVLMEDPTTGADLGQAGAFSWHDTVPTELRSSFGRAMKGGKFAELVGGGWYFWDADENIWWTWDTPNVIERKFYDIMDDLNIGGVFAWGLGEDANDFAHLKALNLGYREWKDRMQGEYGWKTEL